MDRVAITSIEICNFLLNNFFDTVDEDFRKEVKENLKLSEEILEKNKRIKEKK